MLIKGGIFLMENKKTDRRVRRTKRMLLEGLMTLLLEKDIKDISVKELTDYADINRCTFYLHYKDVFHMLDTIEEELFTEFNRILDENFTQSECPTPLPILQDIFYYLLDNKKTVSALLGIHGDFAFVARIKKLLKERIKYAWSLESYKEENFEYYFSFIISGCLGLIETWVQNDFSRSPETMALLSNEMILSGIRAFS